MDSNNTKSRSMKDSTSPEPEIQDALTKLEYLTCLTAHELKGHIEPFGDDYAASQYLDLASDDEISKFLESGSLYDVEKREWRGLGEAECERDVRAMFTTIINAIISNLGRKTESSRTQRFARTTNYSMFAHVEQHGADQCGGPAMVIMATGPSFEDPPRSDGGLDTPFGYTNIASCFQIVMEGDFSEDAQYYADESSVFARQMFVQQPNRRFVRNLLITEEVCHLFHFDRSGAQYTPEIDIHRDPATFIRLVLGLSTYDEEALGLDTSVQWRTENGKKVSGTIAVTNDNDDTTVYELCEMQPVFRRFNIRGRGTTGWRAIGADGVEVFVKDNWRSDECAPEYTILKHVAGVDGASQMLAYETSEVTTITLRANGCRGWSMEGFKNRTSTRIVVEMYGQSILFFKSQRQLFSAVRDAIAAHRTLVNDRHVLHRDISQNNILLGRRGSRAGQRGILVDFDMAVHGERPLCQAPTDFKAGTLLFMSVSVLSSHRTDVPLAPSHDQLDDLESFYCVLYELMCSWKGVGIMVDERPQEVRAWDENPNPMYCLMMKKSHFCSGLAPKTSHIPSFWLPAAVDCIVGFYRIVRSLLVAKLDLDPVFTDKGKEQLESLLTSADLAYDDTLALFDKALRELESQEPLLTADNVEHATAATPTPNPQPLVPNFTDVSAENDPTVRVDRDLPDAPSSGVALSSRKRKAVDDDEGPATRAKRSRRSALSTQPYSPPRTRSTSKKLRLPPPDPPVPRPRTRAAVKAAMLQAQLDAPAVSASTNPRVKTKSLGSTCPRRKLGSEQRVASKTTLRSRLDDAGVVLPLQAPLRVTRSQTKAALAGRVNLR